MTSDAQFVALGDWSSRTFWSCAPPSSSSMTSCARVQKFFYRVTQSLGPIPWQAKQLKNNISSAYPARVQRQLAKHKRLVYLGTCVCCIFFLLSHFHCSLFRHFGAWDCCNSDSDTGALLHMNGYSDPSSSIASNLREWEYLTKIIDTLGKIKSISNNLKQGWTKRSKCNFCFSCLVTRLQAPYFRSNFLNSLDFFFCSNALALVISNWSHMTSNKIISRKNVLLAGNKIHDVIG